MEWSKFILHTMPRAVRFACFNISVRNKKDGEYLAKYDHEVLFLFSDWTYVFPSSGVREALKKYVPEERIYTLNFKENALAVNFYDLMVAIRHLKVSFADEVFCEMLHAFGAGEFDSAKFTVCRDYTTWVDGKLMDKNKFIGKAYY